MIRSKSIPLTENLTIEEFTKLLEQAYAASEKEKGYTRWNSLLTTRRAVAVQAFKRTVSRVVEVEVSEK